MDAAQYFAVDLQPDADEHLTLPLRLVFDMAYERRQTHPDLAIHKGCVTVMGTRGSALASGWPTTPHQRRSTRRRHVNPSGQGFLGFLMRERCPLLLEALSAVFGTRMRTSSGDLAAPDKVEPRLLHFKRPF